jgi:lipopolysaccharide export system permease protein
MSTIAGFLTRMILLRFFTILLGITAFVLTLEVVGYVSDILALGGNPFVAIAKYALMRSPSILSTFLPMSLLLALLLSITELTYRNEMAAIWAAGVSPIRLITMLIPVALVTGGLHFLINDQAIPAAAPTLKMWGIGDYAAKKLNVSSTDPIWIRSGTDIMRATKVSADSRALEDVIVFRRDAGGLLKEQIYAKSAAQDSDRWLLRNVVVYYRNNLPPDRMDTLVYTGAMRPANATRSGDPEEMTLQDLSYFVANQGFGIRPVYVYQTWWHKRLTPFVVALMMISLCIPLATRFRRGGGLGTLFAVGIGLGFLFFVSDGIASTVGELGLVTPWLAAWTPVIIFSTVALGFVARTERV